MAVVIIFFTSSQKHVCPNCQTSLGDNQKILLIFTDEVYSRSFLSSGIIVTKKIVITTILVAFIILALTIKISEMK